MPVAPTYERQVAPAGFPQERVSTSISPDVFGGGRAAEASNQAFQQTADIAQRRFEQIKQRADITATQDFAARLVESENKMLYDPQDGAFSVQGAGVTQGDYIGDYTRTRQEFVDQMIESSAKNPQQREMMMKIARDRGSEFNGQLNRHFFQETEKYEVATDKSLYETLDDDSAKNFTVPGRVENNQKLQEGSALKTYGRKLDPVQMSEMLMQRRSATWRNVLQAQIDAKDVGGARVKFDMLTGKNIPGMIEKGTIDWKSLPGVQNENGTVSSTVTIGVDGGELGMKPGTEVLIPTLWDGERHSTDEAIAHAKETGKHLGVFENSASAQNYEDNVLHPAQERVAKGLSPDNMTAKDIDHIEKLFKVAHDNDAALATAREIESKSPGNYAAQDKALAKITNAEQYEKVRAYLHQKRADADASKKQTEENFVDTAKKIILQKQKDGLAAQGIQQDPASGGWGEPEVVDPFSHLPTSMQAQMTPELKKKIWDGINPNVYDDPDAVQEFERKISDPRTALEFARSDIRGQYQGRVTASRMNHMLEVAASVVSKSGGSDPYITSAKIKTEAIDSAISNGLGINPKAKPGSDEYNMANEFRAAVYDRVKEVEASGKKPDYQQIADDVVAKISVDSGHWFLPNKKIPSYKYEVGMDVLPVKDVGNIPPASLLKIKAAISAKGMRLTGDDLEAEILRRWNLHLQNLRSSGNP